MFYHEPSIGEHYNIQIGLLHGMSQRAIARMLNRSLSTICREIHRNRIVQYAQRGIRQRRILVLPSSREHCLRHSSRP